MDIEIDKAAEQQLTGFLDLIGNVLQYPQRRANFALYALGLIDHERKTIESIAVRNCPDATKADAAHQRLHDFITDSQWDDHAVRLVQLSITYQADNGERVGRGVRCEMPGVKYEASGRQGHHVA